MDSIWQLILALACVVWAAVVVFRRALRLWTGRGRSAGSCASGACTSCPTSSGSASQKDDGFVPIESLARKSRGTAGHSRDA